MRPTEREKGASKLNPAEVDIIVEEVASIVTDPTMQGRMIGVIPLLGDKQAATVRKKLLSAPRIGEDAIDRHRIICGDSRTLQGQERDIVFLSMVVSPGRITARAARLYAQRFDVAMSRARDRVCLVRSVAMGHLEPHDLRYKVVTHLRNPFPDGALRDDADALALCESGFEREVCERLLDAGHRHRVGAQLRVGPHRIALVVEGAEDRRLAIELDGDTHHGPDRRAKDMERRAAL